MPRPRKTSNLSPDRAAQALSILIHEGKLKAQDVARALRRRERLIRELTGKLSSLGHEASATVASLVGRRGPRPGKKPAKISKAQRAARKAQGRYLGAIRRLSAVNRAKIKAIREKSGVRAAIAAARRMGARTTSPTRRRQSTTARKERPAKGRPQKPQKAQSSPGSRREAHAPAPTTT